MAARVLHEIEQRRGWLRPYTKTYDELAASDPIGKSEFDGIVEPMSFAAIEARAQSQRERSDMQG
jgi:hypothetical protein